MLGSVWRIMKNCASWVRESLCLSSHEKKKARPSLLRLKERVLCQVQRPGISTSQLPTSDNPEA